MINKIVLSQDGLVVGNNQLVASGGGIYIGKTIAVDGAVITANLNAYSNTTLSGNVTVAGNVNISGDLVTLTNTSRITEKVNVLNLSANGTININLAESGIHLYRLPLLPNVVVNLTGTSTTPLSSILRPGQSISAVLGLTNSSPAYVPIRYQIDGGTVVPRWQGGSAPSSGSANAIDFYAFTAIRVQEADATNTSTYILLASQTQFK